MTAWLQKVALVAKITVSGFTRDRGFWVVILGAVLTSSVGWWWRDINFGGEEGRFVLNFGLSVQSLSMMLLGIVVVGQLKARQQDSGHLDVVLARGISPSIVVAGEVAGAVGLVAILGWGCAAVLAALLLLGEYTPGWAELIVVSGMQLLKAGVIVALGRWLSAFGRSLIFVMVAAALLTVVGHLKTWTETLGGLGWWLTRPIPNLSWLGEAGYQQGIFDAADVMRALIYASGYMLVFLMLAAKAETRREQ